MNETQHDTSVPGAEDPIDGWRRRYHDLGERAARRDPDTFPMLVSIVELLTSLHEDGESEMRALLARAAGSRLPPPVRVLVANLVWADPTFSDVRDLEERLEALSDDERREAARWAHAKQEAVDFDSEEPIMPGCVAGLYQTLETEPCAD